MSGVATCPLQRAVTTPPNESLSTSLIAYHCHMALAGYATSAVGVEVTRKASTVRP